ncbi:MAG: hypothetical protein AAF725_06355 [Acidobacteriota bacterium]
MRDWWIAWRERPLKWLVPLVFVVFNLLLLVFYQAFFSDRVVSLERIYEEQASDLEELRQEREKAERFTRALERQKEATGVLYEEYFGVEGERFTRMLRDIRTRARQAGMDPKSFAYPESPVEAYGLNRRNVNFAVEGTYEQLRRFINLLELTDQFVTLQSVTLGDAQGAGQGSGEPRLKIRLSLSTLFQEGEFSAQERLAAASATSRRGVATGGETRPAAAGADGEEGVDGEKEGAAAPEEGEEEE